MDAIFSIVPQIQNAAQRTIPFSPHTHQLIDTQISFTADKHTQTHAQTHTCISHFSADFETRVHASPRCGRVDAAPFLDSLQQKQQQQKYTSVLQKEQKESFPWSLASVRSGDALPVSPVYSFSRSLSSHTLSHSVPSLRTSSWTRDGCSNNSSSKMSDEDDEDGGRVPCSSLPAPGTLLSLRKYKSKTTRTHSYTNIRSSTMRSGF